MVEGLSQGRLQDLRAYAHIARILGRFGPVQTVPRIFVDAHKNIIAQFLGVALGVDDAVREAHDTDRSRPIMPLGIFKLDYIHLSHLTMPLKITDSLELSNTSTAVCGLCVILILRALLFGPKAVSHLKLHKCGPAEHHYSPMHPQLE